jgi:ABC-type antimicrobial peptide transport system permease subunit
MCGKPYDLRAVTGVSDGFQMLFVYSYFMTSLEERAKCYSVLLSQTAQEISIKIYMSAQKIIIISRLLRHP